MCGFVFLTRGTACDPRQHNDSSSLLPQTTGRNPTCSTYNDVILVITNTNIVSFLHPTYPSKLASTASPEIKSCRPPLSTPSSSAMAKYLA